MHSLATASVFTESKALPAIFWAWLLCGTLDILAACLLWASRGIAPARVLQGIAAGLLGQRSFEGGAPTAVLGVALHFFIAFVATIVYYGASRKVVFMTNQSVLAGLLYGILVYLFMNGIVLPLSAATRRPHTLSYTLPMVLIHMVCVGLPIALVIRHFSR